MAPILLYQRITQTKNGQEIPVDIFLNKVKKGHWQDKTLEVRTIKDPEQRRVAKSNVPYVTLSGKFEGRTDDGAMEHSGYIGMDADDIDPEAVKEQIKNDRYIYAAFTSIGGHGLCIVFKINGSKHREAFAGLCEYLGEKYGIVCDPTGVNPSRARYISWDPGMLYNPDALKFEIYPKAKPPKKIDPVIFVESDFTRLIAQVSSECINVCENYEEWRNCGFALADQFGEGGRDYFHVISAASATYRPTSQAANSRMVDKQYTACLKAKGIQRVTIATLYHYFKRAGMELYSERSKIIITAAAQAKKGKRTQEDTVANLEKFENIKREDSAAVVQRVFEQDHTPAVSDESEIYQIEQWLRHNYSLRRNLITRRFENNSVGMDQVEMNSIFIAAKKIFDKLTYDLFDRVINSNFTPAYNPLIEFFSNNYHRKPTGAIDKLFATIKTDEPEYVAYFAKKWAVGCIASIYGEVNPLFPVLSGRMHGTGKSEFLRRMIPAELKPYYTEISDGMKENDFNIMMTQKWIIMDDEFAVKRKKELSALKSLLSKKSFTVREPYGRHNVDLVRLANMCGTSNEDDLLSDPTGNRRIIPILVVAIDTDAYNRIDKTDFWMEAYHLYREGYEYQLNRSDIERLNNQTVRFENYSTEYEMLIKWLSKPKPGGWFEEMTSTEIKNKIETLSMQKLSRDMLGKELARMGFQQVHRKVDGRSCRVWQVLFNQGGPERPGSFTAPAGPEPVNTPDFDTENLF